MTTTTLATRPAITPAATVAAYGLRQPTVADARASLERIYGPDEAPSIWAELALSGRVAIDIDEVVTTMLASSHDVVRLCGQALQIRLRSYAHLSAAQAAVG